MEKNPLITIIMSAYNCAPYVQEAIQSILSQTYTNWELLVTDDCSEDNTLEILKRYSLSDCRIKLIANHENRGLTYNLNHMLQLASGVYIARLDADDICRSDRLEKQIKCFERFHCDIVCSYAHGFGDREKKIKSPRRGEDIRAVLLFSCPIVHSSVMFKNEKGLNYDLFFLKAQDYDLWDRMSASGKNFHVITEELVFFRYHKSQISQKFGHVQANYAAVIRARALARLNIAGAAVNALTNWINKGFVQNQTEFILISTLFDMCLSSNNTVCLYNKKSLRRILNAQRAKLLISKIQEDASEKTEFKHRVILFFKSFSIISMKIYIMNLIQ